MGKNIALKIALTIFVSFNIYAQNIRVVNIPDQNFEKALIDKKIDSDNTINGFIKQEDALKVKKLIIANFYISSGGIVTPMRISNLTGIEAFENLDSLDCSISDLTILDVSKNINLKWLDCHGNKIVELRIPHNLETLNCTYNEISTLDISISSKLKNVFCSSNKLLVLDASKNIELEHLDCHSNKLTNLNVSNNPKLLILQCYHNRIAKLDISKSSNLYLLSCLDNSLTELDLTKKSDLKFMGCALNAILTICVDSIDDANLNSRWAKDDFTKYKVCD